jgi:hypothetical protein
MTDYASFGPWPYFGKLCLIKLMVQLDLMALGAQGMIKYGDGPIEAHGFASKGGV